MEKRLKVILLTIGDELLNGRTKDLNGTFLTKFLFEIGADCEEIHFIKDQKNTVLNFIHHSFKSADVIITSGGIGPTKDDLTKEILAEFFKQKVIERSDVEEIVLKNYERFGRTWEKNLNFYHHFPEHFIALDNPKGLAPGLAFYDEKNQKMIFSLPGVPREFEAMLTEKVHSLLKQYFPKKLNANQQVVIRTYGVPEEKIFGEMCPNLWEDLSQFGKVSSLPHTIGIDIVVSLNSNLLFKEVLENIKIIIEKSPLAKQVWNYGKESIEELILNHAIQKNLKIATAESCTGGLIASKITNLSGSSQIFLGSIIAYANEVKNNLLKIDTEIIKNKGAVSLEVVELMALNSREILNADFSVSTSGIAGPTGGSVEKPVGSICIGVASKKQSKSFNYKFPGDRIRLKERFAEMALLQLWLFMKEN